MPITKKIDSFDESDSDDNVGYMLCNDQYIVPVTRHLSDFVYLDMY